ncbi:MAG: flagellar hook-associated protein FlgK [Dehalococcoidia bacterium]|nr:flagellar hook-associated protein FlgK [Dehalococcoidia bacterium]MCA9852683.1 flagellar hook-associated protein FlgK [Dehalococcoidia bacterium]
MGLSIGLDTAVKALRAHQLAVDVAAHNVANAHSPGFSRQRLLLRPIGLDGSDHFTRDALLGRTGFGVDASDVNRVRDIFLDFQLRQAIGSEFQYGAQGSALARAEFTFNDPSDGGMSGLLASFWNSWHDVVNDPEGSPARTTLVHTTNTLTARIRSAHQQLTVQRDNLNFNVGAIAERMNAAASEIAALNVQIKKVELSGDQANDMRDRRDLLLDDLAKMGNISYSEQPDTTVLVYFGNHELVVNAEARTVRAENDPGNPGMSRLVFNLDDALVQVTGGELRGVLDARDTDLPNLITKLNDFAQGLMTQINAVHQTGFGLDNTTGLDFLTGADASDIGLNSVLAANPHQIATAAAANQPGDSSIGLAIANLQLAQTMAGGTMTFDTFYGNMVSVLGADVSRAQGLQESSNMLNSHLEGMRQSVAGVNLDEEMTNLSAAQHAYDAAARVITSIDEMLEQLIMRTGVVGR